MKIIIKCQIIILIFILIAGCSDNPSDAHEEDEPKDEHNAGESSFEVNGEVEGKMTGNSEIVIVVEELPLTGELRYVLRLGIFDDKRVADREFRIGIGVELQNEVIPVTVFELGEWEIVGGTADYTHINKDLIGTDYRTIEGYGGELEITEFDGNTATGSFEFSAATFREGTPFGEITVTEGIFIAPVVVVEDL